VLYIAGSQELSFTPEEEAKLRQFVEDGGLFLGNADCNSRAFIGSFTKLGQKLFPSTEFRDLPDTHPLLTNEQYHRSLFKIKPGLQGLSNGSRELMILMTTDPARIWQTPYDGRLEPYALGADILLYSFDKKGLRNRNVTYTIRPDPKVIPTRSMKLARLSYPGNWDPEPGGWRRMSALLRNRDKIDLQVEPVALGEGKLCQPPPVAPKLDPKDLRQRAMKRIPQDQINAAIAAGETQRIEGMIRAESAKIEAEEAAKAAATRGRNSAYAVAHLTGTTKFGFSPAMVKELKDFVTGGGVLIVDCAGGSTEFAESVQGALEKVLGPEAAAELRSPLPTDSPLFKGMDGKDLYRTYAKSRLGSTKSPRLRGAKVGDRMAIFYSPDDLSTGMVGQEVDGVVGYTPEVATELVERMIVGAAGG